MSQPRPFSQPALQIAPELLLLAQDVRVAFFDVDGVLTDGGLYFGERRGEPADAGASAQESIKRFHTLDGHGLKMLQRGGITPVVISGRDSVPLRARLHALGIGHVHLGQEDKLPVAEQTLQTLGLNWSQAAAMGDDWPDLPLMRRAAISCAPPNAHAEVLASAHLVTQVPGGQGAARQWCDLLLMANGRYVQLLQEYLR
jgi:3-deoxy-D-manno-octulosonate 8-phosphate phosphatase (KDO 8-P phosphatase)